MLLWQDIEGKDVIAFAMVVQLINSLVPLGDRRASFSATPTLQDIHPGNGKSPFLIGYTPAETNIAPENGWLEY